MSRLLLVLLIFITVSANARDFGVRGPVYEIKEPDLLDQIMLRAQKLQDTGELDKLTNEAKLRSIQKAMRPEPIAGISPAIKNKSWEYDPTFTLDHDITDHNDKIVARRGTKVNPLEVVQLEADFLFINADRAKEVDFIREKVARAAKPIKIVLLSGKIDKTADILGTPVYFDQKGILSSRFGITHTPAIVRQVGEFLLIEEVAV